MPTGALLLREVAPKVFLGRKRVVRPTPQREIAWQVLTALRERSQMMQLQAMRFAAPPPRPALLDPPPRRSGLPKTSFFEVGNQQTHSPQMDLLERALAVHMRQQRLCPLHQLHVLLFHASTSAKCASNIAKIWFEAPTSRRVPAISSS